MHARHLFRVIPLLALGACATVGPLAVPPTEMRGHYTGTPGSWFRPCEGADSLWVTFTDRAVAQRDSAAAAGGIRPGASSFVRWRGVVGEPGQRGSTGPGTRFVLVRELLEARPASAADCSGRP